MEIRNMKLEELYPHPDNPRKDIGDITELADSIRKNGIMQNLTVVPGHCLTLEEYKAQYHAVGGNNKDAEHYYKANRESAFVGDGYTVVIGHRRMAAAKAAGLSEVPCIIADMDERQQLCTMMEENMQRQDLTVIEQAYGFQYMLDLGETVESIAQKTGFGETTVRHRLQIAKLDPKVLEENQKKSGYQLSIADLIELEKVKSVNTRNELIKTAYSHADLISKVDAAQRKEKADLALEKLRPLLESKGAEPMPKTVYTWTVGVEEFTPGRIDLKKKLPKQVKTPADLPEGAKLYYKVDYYDSVLKTYIKTDPKRRSKTKEDRQREEEKKKQKALEERRDTEIDKICRFIDLIDGAKIHAQKGEADAIPQIWQTAIKSGVELGRGQILTARGLPEYSTNPEEEEAIDRFLQRKLSTQMIVMMGQNLNKYRFDPVSYDRSFSKEQGRRLQAVISLLEDLYEFQPSEDLRQIADGKHELYKKGDSGDENG